MPTIRRPEVEQFCAAVVSRLGLCANEHNIDQAGQVLRQRLRQADCDSVACYLGRLADDRFLQQELREVAADLSVGETYFFRHPEHFRALEEVALPDRLRVRRDSRQLRVLSAGCATGEEAYSVAAAVRKALPAGWDVRIWGIDVNYRAVQAAMAGCYRAWSLRGVPQGERRLYFHQQGDTYSLNDDIRRMVSFEERSLVREDQAFWQPAFFDFIFCRNVIMYLTPEVIAQVVRRMAHSTAPGGYLFLSPSETLRGLTQEFHLRHTHGAFYYQRRWPGEVVQRHVVWPARAGTSEEPAGQQADLPVEQDVSWMDAIARANSRITALANRAKQPERVKGHAAPGSPLSPPGAAPGKHSLEAVRDLLRQERFEDALRHLHAMPATTQPDPDALLLQAVLLVNKADVARARKVCEQLLALDELNAGAHYLMAVCQEQAGDRLAAAEHDQTAIYLDDTFAMPHLHLGQLAQRMGDVGTAQRELGEALVLLAREDASRILLFGGGFEREALVQYCQSLLRSSGAGR